MPDQALLTTEFALAVRSYALAQGVPQDHPRLQGRFARRVAAMVIDGLVEAERLRGRWYVRPQQVPLAARILGLLPAPAELAAGPAQEKTPR